MKKHVAILLLLSVALLVALALCSLCGATTVQWRDVWHSPIVWQIRVPRQLLAIAVGGSLAVCGAVYQALFRNPLADPYLLGISSGASLGATIAMVCGLEAWAYGVPVAAFVVALLTVALLFAIAAHGNKMHISTLLLAGVCLTLLISAIVSFIMVWHHDKMERIIFWTMGGFAATSWTDVAICVPVLVVGVVALLFFAKDLNLLMAGRDAARTMGVDVERIQRWLLVITSLLVAFAVASSGVIGFVGLLVPHAMRLLVGSDNRRLMPLAALGGALFMLLTDTAARSLFQPAEMPVGTITAIVGAPLFIFLLYRRRRSL